MLTHVTSHFPRNRHNSRMHRRSSSRAASGIVSASQPLKSKTNSSRLLREAIAEAKEPRSAKAGSCVSHSSSFVSFVSCISALARPAALLSNKEPVKRKLSSRSCLDPKASKASRAKRPEKPRSRRRTRRASGRLPTRTRKSPSEKVRQPVKDNCTTVLDASARKAVASVWVASPFST